MSPVPIIQRQRALSRVGEIRIGGEKPERGAGRKLETFRLTSQHKDVIDRCASLYGGEPKPWQSPSGDAFQLYTTSAALPVLLITDYSLNQVYERWEGATKCTRRCDGEEEQISGGPCVCNAQGLEGKAACDIITRLMVVLPETGTSLGWTLRSTGENAARELSGAIMVSGELARGRAFVPATLRLTQRRSVIDGQVVRYVVPVLDFNLLAEARQQLEAPPAVAGELGYTPAQPKELEAGVTVAEGLAGAEESAAPKSRNGRQAAPIPAGDDFGFGDEPVPVPADNGEPGSSSRAAAPAGQPPPNVPPKPTKAQLGKLGALVKKLRDETGTITTEQLWKSLAKTRSFDFDQMVELLGGLDDEGVLHWGPLLATLTRPEASDLIDRLSALEQEPAAA